MPHPEVFFALSLGLSHHVEANDSQKENAQALGTTGLCSKHLTRARYIPGTIPGMGHVALKRKSLYLQVALGQKEQNLNM